MKRVTWIKIRSLVLFITIFSLLSYWYIWSYDNLYSWVFGLTTFGTMVGSGILVVFYAELNPFNFKPFKEVKWSIGDKLERCYIGIKSSNDKCQIFYYKETFMGFYKLGVSLKMVNINSDINSIIKNDLEKIEKGILDEREKSRKKKSIPLTIKDNINNWDGIATDKIHLLRDDSIDKL